jgi:hypothetical protein
MILSAVWGLTAVGLSYFTWKRGQDINYDLMNYHRFIVPAGLSSEPFRNIAGLQQFQNPLIYLPHYILNELMSPLKAAVVLTWLQALNIPLVYVMGRLVARKLPLSRIARRAIALLGAAVGVFGPMFLTETGTSFADTLAAIPILAGVCLLLLGADATHQRLALTGAAGLMFGAAVGLKLTNATAAVGAAIAVIAMPSAGTAICALALGGILGSMVTYGYWGYRLWSAFDSPIFPFYNGIFKSQFYIFDNMIDPRFHPQSVLDGLSYPFQWVIGLHPSSELPFWDLRFAILFVLLLALLMAAPWKILQTRSMRSAVRFGRVPAVLVLFSASTYVPWISVFGIQRYLVSVELVAGPTLIALLVLLRIPAKAFMVTASALMLPICLWTRHSDFGHSTWTYHLSQTHLPKHILDADAIFLLLGEPMTYIIPDFGGKARFFGIGMIPDPSNKMGNLFRTLLATHRGPIYSIQGGLMSKRAPDFLNAFNLRQHGIDCLHFSTNVGARVVGLGLCPVTLNPRPLPTSAMTYPLGRLVEFAGPYRNSVFYAVSGWGAESDAGRAWADDANSVRIHLEIAEQPTSALLGTVQFASPVNRCKIAVAVNNVDIDLGIPPDTCLGDELSIPVNGSLIPPSGEFNLQFRPRDSHFDRVIVQSFKLVAN